MTRTPTFTRGELNVVRRTDDVVRTVAALRGIGQTIALVPTMGALHEGHLELVRRAKRLPGNVTVAVSIFVNPLQFGAGEDLDAYPRTMDSDLDKLRAAGVELAFTPDVDDLYAADAAVTIDPGQLGRELEGAARPGHFAGVLTVVAKLLNVLRPGYAFFGEKDYQQLVLIRKMVRDLDVATSIVGVPTVREHDGLALSSRNSYLTDEQRAQAVVLSAALVAGAHAAPRGADAALAAASETLAARPEVDVDYLQLRSPELAAAPATGPARLLVAAKVGETRLIDNVGVALGDARDE